MARVPEHDGDRPSATAEDGVTQYRSLFAEHLDSAALEAIGRVVRTLVVETRPEVLDLQAGWESFLPSSLEPARVVGIGVDGEELQRNRDLTEGIVQDLNLEPTLPFAAASFDVVLSTLSVEYFARPVEVFAEAGRVLRPGGLFLVVFPDRVSPVRGAQVWRDCDDQERVILVESFLASAAAFGPTWRYVSKLPPAGADGRGARIFAVYGDRLGDDGKVVAGPPRTLEGAERTADVVAEEYERRKALVARTLCCPHCGASLTRSPVPQTPYTTWDAEFLYVCLNDDCPYFRRSPATLGRQGVEGFAYRQMYDPLRDALMPILVAAPGGAATVETASSG